MFLAPRNNDTTAEFSVTQSQSTLTPSGYLSKIVILWWFQNIFFINRLPVPTRKTKHLITRYDTAISVEKVNYEKNASLCTANFIA